MSKWKWNFYLEAETELGSNVKHVFMVENGSAYHYYTMRITVPYTRIIKKFVLFMWSLGWFVY